MDFQFAPHHEAFRRQVLAFLAGTLTAEFWAHHREHELPGWSPRFSREAAARSSHCQIREPLIIIGRA